VGIGWQREEYEAAGLDFSRRGVLLDRCLAVCRALWTEPVAAFDDGELAFAGIHAMPKPVQPGGVPVWVSGRIGPRTVDRLVRFGSGWIPWGDDVADPGPGVAVLRDALAAAGRDPATLQVQGTLRVVRRDGDGGVDLERTMAAVAPLLDVGVTDLRLSARWGPDPAEAEALLGEAVRAFRAAVGRPAP
jgi:alkanesulfonate monooxygenase SsuD/methylene tetrahydromethanopterin reductase-like flavin-dependent oxidoreductase (luciferase family)